VKYEAMSIIDKVTIVIYLDFGDAVRGQLDVGEVSLAQRHGVHRVSAYTLDLLAHRAVVEGSASASG